MTLELEDLSEENSLLRLALKSRIKEFRRLLDHWFGDANQEDALDYALDAFKFLQTAGKHFGVQFLGTRKFESKRAFVTDFLRESSHLSSKLSVQGDVLTGFIRRLKEGKSPAGLTDCLEETRRLHVKALEMGDILTDVNDVLGSRMQEAQMFADLSQVAMAGASLDADFDNFFSGVPQNRQTIFGPLFKCQVLTSSFVSKTQKLIDTKTGYFYIEDIRKAVNSQITALDTLQHRLLFYLLMVLNCLMGHKEAGFPYDSEEFMRSQANQMLKELRLGALEKPNSKTRTLPLIPRYVFHPTLGSLNREFPKANPSEPSNLKDIHAYLSVDIVRTELAVIRSTIWELIELKRQASQMANLVTHDVLLIFRGCRTLEIRLAPLVREVIPQIIGAFFLRAEPRLDDWHEHSWKAAVYCPDCGTGWCPWDLKMLVAFWRTLMKHLANRETGGTFEDWWTQVSPVLAKGEEFSFSGVPSSHLVQLARFAFTQN